MYDTAFPSSRKAGVHLFSLSRVIAVKLIQADNDDVASGSESNTDIIQQIYRNTITWLGYKTEG